MTHHNRAPWRVRNISQIRKKGRLILMIKHVNVQYLCLVSQNDKDTIRQRSHRYPHSILQYLEATHIILYQKRYCTHIRMRLQSKSKVWLWTRRIIANCDILINFSNRLFYIRWWQVLTSRDDTQQSLSKIFHAVAVFHNSIPANALHVLASVFQEKKISGVMFWQGWK